VFLFYENKNKTTGAKTNVTTPVMPDNLLGVLRFQQQQLSRSAEMPHTVRTPMQAQFSCNSFEILYFFIFFFFDFLKKQKKTSSDSIALCCYGRKFKCYHCSINACTSINQCCL